jgi:hypothetical protein
MDAPGGAAFYEPRVVIVRDVPEYTPWMEPKPFSSPPPMLGSPVVGELGHRVGSQIADVHARTHAAYPPAFGSDSPHFPGQSFSAVGPQPSMKANSATLGYFREVAQRQGTVMYPWPPAPPSQAFLPAQHAAGHPRVAEQHQISPAAEEGKKKPGKRISAILGYELDDCSTKDRGLTYYSQQRWQHVSDNFSDVRPEHELEPTGCTAWIFSYSTDFLTSGMNWKNDKNEIMFHLRRDPNTRVTDRNRLVMNSCAEPVAFFNKMVLGGLGISQTWGFEEHVSFPPADVGDDIHLRQFAVCVDDAGFHVAWGGKVQYTFKHRLPWPSFKFFEVDPAKWESLGFLALRDAKYAEQTFFLLKSTTLQSMLTSLRIADKTCTEKKSSTNLQELQRMLMSTCMTRDPLFDNKEVRGSALLRVATWDGKERKFLTVDDTHQRKVKVGNIKEVICAVLDVPELTKHEFDKWFNLRRTHQWKTIFPVIFSHFKTKQSIFTVAQQNCEVLLTLHEERVLLELVLENSKPLLVSVVFSGAIRQYAREERSRDHQRANSADVLAAALENLACSIVRRVAVQLLEPERSLQGERATSKKEMEKEMDEVLEFATTHRMKAFISEPVIVALVNSKWSDTNFAADFIKFFPDFLNPYNYQNIFVQCFLIVFFPIHVIVWELPLTLLTSSWAPAWRFWAFQASYLTYAMLAWYLPKLCNSMGWIRDESWSACLEYGKADDDCCGALRNLI